MARLILAAAALLLVLCAPARAQRGQPPVPVAQVDLPAPAGLLPEGLRPLSYRLDLSVDPGSERFSGKVEIDVELAAAARAIHLHGRGLAMRSAQALAGGKAYPGEWRQVDPSGVARLVFAQPLPAGPVTLSFEYDAPFNDGPSGLYRVKVGDDWYSWSQFQSIDARAVFPSFDQPSFKTPFAVTLRTPPGLMAISNAPEASLSREDGRDVHRFVPTLPLPTYLVAVVVGPFAAVAGEVPPSPQRATPLPLRVVAARPHAGRLDFALEESKRIVILLEDYFGDAFPFPKLDQIASPVMPGAMENAGADIYDDAMIVMDADAPLEQRQIFGRIVAHELAHQWFGDLVTPRWWDDIWLNESFANWMGYRIGDAWRPELGIGAGNRAEGFRAMDVDALSVGRPIRQPIETNAQIDAAFDSITYGKGGQVVAMIAAYMGDEKFRDGVRRYMAAHRFGNATSSDFFAALAEAAGDPRIIEAMRAFTEQQGVPLLSFRRDGDRYTVTQSRHGLPGTPIASTQWIVPMCVRRGPRRLCQLLDKPSTDFDLPGSHSLVPNAGGAGYYRFDLTQREWDLLIADVGALTGGEAVAVSDSLAASVWSGRATVGQMGDLTRQLMRHPDGAAWAAVVEDMGELAASGLVDSNGRRGWRNFRSKLFAPQLRRLGFDPRAGAHAADAPDRSARRVRLVEGLAGTPRGSGINRQLVRAADEYLAGNSSALDPAWFSPALDLHLNRTGEAGARALLERALASEDPLFRPAALQAVATSGYKPVARWLLFDLSDARLRSSERIDLLQGVIATRNTTDIGYEWLRDNIGPLMHGQGGIFVTAQMQWLFGRFCSAERANAMARDLRPRVAGTPGELELERAIEKVRKCGIVQERLGTILSEEFAELK